jgi:hypothetical protein
VKGAVAVFASASGCFSRDVRQATAGCASHDEILQKRKPDEIAKPEELPLPQVICTPKKVPPEVCAKKVAPKSPVKKARPTKATKAKKRKRKK